MTEISRQRKWQLKKLQEDNCVSCGHPLNKYKQFCDDCSAKKRRYYWKNKKRLEDLVLRHGEQNRKWIVDALAWARIEVKEGRLKRGFDKELFVEETLGRGRRPYERSY
jgi:predicted amidophosphoribosyltransferase